MPKNQMISGIGFVVLVLAGAVVGSRSGRAGALEPEDHSSQRQVSFNARRDLIVPGRAPYGAGPVSVAVGNFDSDGSADLAVADLSLDSASIRVFGPEYLGRAGPDRSTC
jgi:hypothetical protein